MPHVLAAWVRWTGAKAGFGPAAVSQALDAVYDSMGAFTRVYHDPASFGLGKPGRPAAAGLRPGRCAPGVRVRRAGRPMGRT
jgi:hypothetical protein